MKTIIFDTNALMAIGEFKVDLFQKIEESCHYLYRIAVLEGTIIELKQIKAEQGGKYKQAAELSLDLITKKKLLIIPGLGKVDDLLVKCSKKGYLVLTQDRELKKRLKKPYLTIRQKKKIIVVN